MRFFLENISRVEINPNNPISYCEYYQKLGYKKRSKEAALGLLVCSRLLFEFRIFVFELIDSTGRIN